MRSILFLSAMFLAPFLGCDSPKPQTPPPAEAPADGADVRIETGRPGGVDVNVDVDPAPGGPAVDVDVNRSAPP